MKNIKYLAFTLFFSILLSAIVLFYCYYNNFYTVIPHTIYRSRQLSQKQFEKFIRQYHIKSVLNLRGEHKTDDWYLAEIKAMKNTQTTHYDLGLLSTQLPSLTDMQTLVAMIDTSPKPLLIHCESGVDRAGLASAIALILAQNSSVAQIRAQTSMKYFVIYSNSVGKQFLERYLTWLKKNNLQTNRDNLLKFLAKHYPNDK